MSHFHVVSDLYNGLFLIQCSNPEVSVNYSMWNRIKSGLPRHYVMPDPKMLTILKQMK